MFLSHYYKERSLYDRPVQLLDILDNFAREAFDDEDFSMKEDDPRMIILRREFSDVLNPVDVEKSLKEIYPESLYTPPGN